MFTSDNENIKYAKPDATYEDVITAAKLSGAHDFIIKLPDGYNTKIGFGFKDLSGGEKQKTGGHDGADRDFGAPALCRSERMV